MDDPGVGEPLIEVRGLHFRYPTGRREALAGIDLTVRRGEFVGVTGHSGAGKSTLCLCLKGLVPPGDLSGTIRVAGQEVRQNGPYLERSALVFQDPETQIIGLTVAEDLAFGPENLELDPSDIRARIPRYLSQVRLDGHGDRETFRLSGGRRCNWRERSSDSPSDRLVELRFERQRSASGAVAS